MGQHYILPKISFCRGDGISSWHPDNKPTRADNNTRDNHCRDTHARPYRARDNSARYKSFFWSKTQIKVIVEYMKYVIL